MFDLEAPTGRSQATKRLAGCGMCRLHKHCKSPKMQPSGKGEKGILVISNAPDDFEDRQNAQLVSEPGQLLRRRFRKLGIDLDRDCRTLNAVACRTPANRPPSQTEIECCRPNVWKEIEEFNPKLIILLGDAALGSFLGHRWKKNLGTIKKWRGWTIPDRQVNAWVCPVSHPSTILENEKNTPIPGLLWDQDLERALDLIRCPVYRPTMNEQSMVNVILDEKELCDRLFQIYEWADLVSIDYETTGLKPHAEGHEIVSASITMNGGGTYAFLMPKEGKARALFRKILMAPRIKKAAHNMKFEDTWTEVRLPGLVQGWYWDSMIAAHIIDNREDITSLKFQAYVHFGVLPYNEHIEPFLKGTTPGGNAFNRISKIPVQDLLIYNGLDTIFELDLALKQMSILGFPDLSKG